MGRLACRLGLAERPRPVGARPRELLLLIGLGLRRDSSRVRGVLRLPAGVGAALGDELLLAAGELDLALQLVLGDRALPLHRHRPSFVGGPVGLLLNLLAGRGAQRLLHLRLRSQRDHPGADDRDSRLG